MYTKVGYINNTALPNFLKERGYKLLENYGNDNIIIKKDDVIIEINLYSNEKPLRFCIAFHKGMEVLDVAMHTYGYLEESDKFLKDENIGPLVSKKLRKRLYNLVKDNIFSFDDLTLTDVLRMIDSLQ